MIDIMPKEVTRYWWALALRGLVAVLFGIAAFVWPELTLRVLVLLFGAFVLADGIFAVLYALGSDVPFRGMLLAEGLIGIAVGIAALFWTEITQQIILYLIAAWAVVTGILEIAAAIDLRKVIEGEWLLALGGLASVAFGVLVALQPNAGALALIWLIGAYAIVFGVSLIALGFRLRSLGQPQESSVDGAGSSQGGAAIRT
jgi:uncharacterized membrane protein HdeD (DUF308 family)